MGCNSSSPQANNRQDGDKHDNGDAHSDKTKNSKLDQNKQLRAEYTLGQVLGQGAFGVVYACAKNGTNQFSYAVKMVDKVETPVNDIKAEADMLKLLAHPNVVKFHNLYFEKFFVCIVMDRYEGGDLIEGMQAHWKHKGQIPCTKVIHVSRQMCAAIEHMHSKSVVHRDVKGDNYLMDRKDLLDRECKIIMSDFGTAYQLKAGERLSSAVGTKIYWPPEFYDRNYGLKVDMWALGVIMYGLLVGRFPFKNETDARKKEVKLPNNTPKKCEAYIIGLLQKKEDDRFTAEQAFAHPWVHDQNNNEEVQIDSNFKPEGLNEGGPNAGVAARREELVDRMEGKERGKRDRTVLAILRQPCFEVHNKHTSRTLKYEWWSKQRVEQERVINMEGATTEANDGVCSTQSLSVVHKMLKEHGISTDDWGHGEAKTLQEFVSEVHSGKVVLMLDASEHKKLVRVVDTVLMRITFNPHQEDPRANGRPNAARTNEGSQLVFIENNEVYSDGRTRAIVRLPGTKKEPHENTKTCCQRILKDHLGIEELAVTFNIATKEVFEEETSSISYPGVRTVYRKEIVEGKVTCHQAPVLARYGLDKRDGGGTHSYREPRGSQKEYVWMTERACEENGKIKLRAPAEGEEISGLIQAPIGYSLEELTEFLDKHGVDTTRFGQNNAKTLQEFSTELIKGEASLMQRDGQVIRVVDIVCLLLHKGQDLLVMTWETHPDKTKHKLNLLPGAKRRPDENQFLTAQRILKRQLKLDENCVNLNATDVKILEEEKDSHSYPGMHTLYRKRIIMAELHFPDDLA